MSEAARQAFEQDAKTRDRGAYADVDLRLYRTDAGYVNPVWNADWLLWQRAWNAGVAAAIWRPAGVGEDGGVRAAMVKLSKALGHPKTVEGNEGQCVEAVLIEMAAERIAGVTRPDGQTFPPSPPDESSL